MFLFWFISFSFCLHLYVCETYPKSPNIIFILADDLGWDDVGFHGSEIHTPNIDKLAHEGVILDNYYVQPLCTQSRGALLTGRYPIHTGLQHYVIAGSQPYGLPLTELTLANHLKALGYSTHAIGKWHLGFFKSSYLPTNRGFDTHTGYYLGLEDYFDHYGSDGGYTGYDFHHNGKALWNKSEVYSTEIYTKEAEFIIHAHDKSKPLFMYLAHQGVHAGNAADGIQAPLDYIHRFKYIKNWRRRMFAGVVAAVDDSVGRVYKALQETGMAENTIIVFSTDNGGPSNNYDHNEACNWPLRGTKNTLWQGGVRGVGFVHSPLLQKTGYANKNLMHITDWVPTLYHIASGHKTLEGVDGQNQWDVISKDEITKRKEVLLNIDPVLKHESLIVSDFKIIQGDVSGHRNDGWYPPPDSASVSERRSSASADVYEYNESKYLDTLAQLQSRPKQKQKALKMDSNYLKDLITFMNKLYKHRIYESSHELFMQTGQPLVKPSIRDGNVTDVKKAVIVDCGKKPKNASMNCKPETQACLYNIRHDPCEYHNIANLLPEIVEVMKKRLQFYNESMVPPLNKPIDPKGNPQLHGGVWQPWL